MSCLEVKNVSKSFSGIKAVQNVSLKAERGKIVSMIGPNGAGKTTTFNLITGIYPIDGGEITLDGVSLVGKPQHAISLMGVGRTFQNIRLFQGMSVIQNVMTGYDPRLTYNLFDGMLCTPRAGGWTGNPGALHGGAGDRRHRRLRAGEPLEAALRPAAQTGDRPRAGDAAEAFAAG